MLTAVHARGLQACLKHFHKVFISWRCQAAAATAEAKAVQGARNQYQRLLLRRFVEVTGALGILAGY